MIKPKFKQWLLLASLVFGSYLGSAQVAVGNIDLQQVSNNPNNPSGICQCDTIRVRYELKTSFSSATEFKYELSQDINTPINWATADDLSLVALYTQVTPTEVLAASVSDTFNQTTGPKLLWADVAVPCNAGLFGRALRITNRDNFNNITPLGSSDTAFFNVNRIPTIADLDFAVLISGGSRQPTFDNPYTPNDDIGFCPGDTVVLRVSSDGNGFQWYNNNVPLFMENNDSIVLTSGGQYKCEIIDGPCSIFTKDTLVTMLSTPTNINVNFVASGNINSIDNPNATGPNRSILDSIQFCETETAVLEAPTSTDVVFTYEWIAGYETNGFNGPDTVFYSLNQTGQTLNLAKSLMNDTLNSMIFLVTDDGFCRDTTRDFPIHYWIDTIPDTRINIIEFPTAPPGISSPFDYCMKDSVVLNSNDIGINWKFQWQRLNTGIANPVWQNIVGDTFRAIQIDTSIKPIRPLSYYRLQTWQETAFGDRTCSYFTDSVRVRWYPEDSSIFVPSSLGNLVGTDSVVMCITDSVTLRAPGAPITPNNTLIYSYQWLTDSTNILGERIIYPLAGETNRDFIADTAGRFYALIDDGICTDTVRWFRVFTDTLAENVILDDAGTPVGTAAINLCLYDSITVTTSEVTGLPRPWDYQWQRLNPLTNVWEDLVGDTNTSITIDRFYLPFEDTTYYRLETSYTNQFDLDVCPFYTDSIQIIWFAPPTLSFFPGDSLGLCFGDSVLVIAQGTGNTYRWNNGTSLGASIWLKGAGAYPVVSTGANGCETRDTVYIYEFIPKADAGPNVSALSGEIVELSGLGGLNYRWYASQPINFSDFLSQTISVSYTLPDGVNADTITIYMEATDDNSCTDSDSLTFIVTREEDPITESKLDLSYNLFSPNGDGFNDLWDMTKVIEGETACEITILNRWGSPVYVDETFDGIWDGNDTGGNPLADGTYYYILSCQGEIIVKSAVTIIRND